MRSWHRDTATRLRPALITNAHGESRTSWKDADELELTGLRITTVNGTEDDGLTELTHLLSGPITIDLDAGDRVRWTDPRGITHVADVSGVPIIHRGISGAVAHLNVNLVEVNV